MAKKSTFEKYLDTIAKAEKGSGVNEAVHYTDASKYAKEYYGETYYETTKHDNDWGDY